MKIKSVTLDGFRGHTMTVELPTVGVITGPNGTGKSSVADGIFLALTQRIPGAAADRDGMAAVDVLDDATPARGDFAVSVVDSDGGTCGFRFRASETGAGSRSLHLSGVDAKKNETVRAAIVARYGTAVGSPIMVDANTLRTMPADQLEQVVLRLCANKVPWGLAEVQAELAKHTLAQVKPESVRILDLTDASLTAEFISAGAFEVEEPRDVFERLGDVIKNRRTHWRSTVLSTTKTLEQDVPEAMDADGITALHGQYMIAAQRTNQAREQLGVLQGRAQAQAQVVQAQQRERNAKQGELDGLRRQFDALKRDRLNRENEVTRLRTELAEPTFLEARPANGPSEDAVAGAQLAKTNAESRLNELRSQKPSIRPELLAEIAACEAKIQEYKSSIGKKQGIESHLLSRMTKFHAGTCPECGQQTNSVTYSISSELAQVQSDLAELRAWMQPQEQRLAALRAEQQAAEQSSRKHNADLDDATVGFQNATATLHRMELQRAQAAQDQDAATAVAVERRQQKTTALAAAVSAISDIDAKLPGIQAQIASAESELAAAAPLGQHPDGEVATQRLAVIDCEKAETAANEAYQAQKARRDFADGLLQAKADAKILRERAQAWSDVWKVAEFAANRVEREFMAALVGPLVTPVNKMAAAYKLGLGEFAVKFGRRFQMGWEKPENAGFAPLGALSAGHLTLTLLLVATAVHKLANTSIRSVIVDGGEALDAVNRPVFGRLATWLVDKGHIEQVVVMSVDPDGWEIPTMSIEPFKMDLAA